MNDNVKEIYLAGRCFWRTEHYGYCHLPLELFEFAKHFNI